MNGRVIPKMGGVNTTGIPSILPVLSSIRGGFGGAIRLYPVEAVLLACEKHVESILSFNFRNLVI